LLHGKKKKEKKKRESIVKCFFIGNQKIVLFPKFRKNGWKAIASALIRLILKKEDEEG
jgi:hypothetical protein